MAFTSRLLSRSKQMTQLCGGGSSSSSQVILKKERAIPVRFFAKEAATQALAGDEMLKSIFMDVKTKFSAAIAALKQGEKITIAPEDPAAVAHYAKIMKTVREKAGLYSESERIDHSIEEETEDILDVRTYLETVRELATQDHLFVDDGAEAMMMEALEKVEKEIKKPLMRNDKKGMGLLMAEFDKINKKLGIRAEDLPKYEEELELKIAKAELEDLKADVLEAIETQRKREEFKHEPPVDVKSLDIRNFL